MARERENRSTYGIVARGLVQGVGFRPFVYRTAREHKLDGWVRNTNENVRIRIRATKRELNAFLDALRNGVPPAAEIRSLITEPGPDEPFDGFRILPSENESDRTTRVSPDIAVCEECLADMKRQSHRIDYPLVNCTHCGPRFSIITALPYDRANTTMKNFKMCPVCNSEYSDVGDRRFHAQPVACNDCGPVYTLTAGGKTISATSRIVAECARMIGQGSILAVKGAGGYHLACSAFDRESVARLREGKHREAKPFAVMFRDLASVREFAETDDLEEELLTSWRRPILILKSRKALAPAVSNGFGTVGTMLPYMPFHHLLFRELDIPALVMTSGNLSDEPVIISEQQAMKMLAPLADGVVSYNRQIFNRTDDSVLRVIRSQARPVRRSRGFVPQPVWMDCNVDGIFAAGAELVNCFCIGKGDEAIMSQHIGDLRNLETYDFYRESAGRFSGLFRADPSLAVHDMHPDYLSTRYAQELGVESLAVQHHHAHIVSVMAEHGISDRVIGVALDGTGYGTDGHIWGGEFLVCDRVDFERVTHFRYMPMPGGDAVTREPWRMAVSWLHAVFGDGLFGLGLPFLERIPGDSIRLAVEMIEKRVNVPLSSGAGRLFDAVSALLDVCAVSHFHAEAPMRLEDAAADGEDGRYEFGAGAVIDFAPMFREMVGEIGNGVATGTIAARFHNTVAAVIRETCMKIREERGLNTILLSGGTFQNRYLLERSLDLLETEGFTAHSNAVVPANDGGIALGQLAIAAAHRTGR